VISKAQSRILFVLHKSRVSPRGAPSAAYIRCLDARPHGCWLDRVLTPTRCPKEDHVKLYHQGSPHAGCEEVRGPITSQFYGQRRERGQRCVGLTTPRGKTKGTHVSKVEERGERRGE